jgi:thymidylate synthase
MVLPPCHYGFQVYTRELSHKERCDAYMKWSNDPKCVEWKTHIENEMGWDYEKPEWVFKEVREQLDKAQFPTRTISLMWTQRSVDTFLGLPFNIASYGLLLEIIAKEVNMVPDELIGNLGDVHLYSNHKEQAVEQIGREPFELPTLKIKPTLFEFGKPEPNKLDLDYYSIHNFELENYQSHEAIKAPLSN